MTDKITTVNYVAMALARRHYQQRFGTLHSQHIEDNVKANYHIFILEAKIAIEALGYILVKNDPNGNAGDEIIVNIYIRRALEE